jgi:m7GpppX diphosphatase
MSPGVYWDSLTVERTLNVDWHTKYIALLVNIQSDAHPDGAGSVLLATRQGFDSAQQLLNLFKSASTQREFKLLDHNDIYYRFLVGTDSAEDCKLTLIHPATPAHIAKYTRQDRIIVAETPALYQSVVLPWIDAHGSSRLKWVENILNGISEQDRLLYRSDDPTNGFILLPDCKWDQTSLTSLYLLAILSRRNVRSLRDLTAEHLPVLKEIRRIVHQVVSDSYKLDPRKLRMYVHYLPTYYYLHVHIVHVDLEASGCAVGAAHLLDDIIDNIEHISSDYYQRRTLHFYIGTEHELCPSLQ